MLFLDKREKLHFYPASTQTMQLTHDDHAPLNKHPIKLLLNNVRVTANIGNLFRLADALGVEEILLCGETTTMPNRKIMRVSRSAHKYVDYRYCQDPLVSIDQLRGLGYKIICLEITDSSVDILSFVLPVNSKVCLVIGSEVDGIDDSILAISDDIIHITMHGNNSSMNVGMAAAIALHRLTDLISS